MKNPIAQFDLRLGLEGEVGRGAELTTLIFDDCFSSAMVSIATIDAVSARSFDFVGESVLAVILKISVLFTTAKLIDFFISLSDILVLARLFTFL